jgi:triosephosphate isomerase (TIM)
LQPLNANTDKYITQTKNIKTMRRKKIVAGNWKMNTNFETAAALTKGILSDTTPSDRVTVVFAPPFPFIHTVGTMAAGRGDVQLAAQNCHTEASGAYTGEVSAPMLASFGVSYVLVGHSERRQYFHETGAELAKKIDAVLAANMTPIFCCGESLEVREAGTQLDFVSAQIAESLFHLSAETIKAMVIAYEPIWAIGTGKTATTEQAQAMHEALRGVIAKRFDQSTANAVRILYGGSCNAQNAATLFAQPDIDGGLIGGASLKIYDFVAIIDAAKN